VAEEAPAVDEAPVAEEAAVEEIAEPAEVYGESVAKAPNSTETSEVSAVLTPKARRSQLRAARAAKRPTPVAATPEERQAARVELRKAKAKARTRQRAQARAKYKASEHERTPTPPREHVAGNQKQRQGVVVSDKADKTITVRIDVQRPHRKYHKIVRTSTTFHAHDERNDAHTGDTVVIQESRPLSATKRWRLIEVVDRAR
jgi:small subunit ribosomal protein S17